MLYIRWHVSLSGFTCILSISATKPILIRLVAAGENPSTCATLVFAAECQGDKDKDEEDEDEDDDDDDDDDGPADEPGEPALLASLFTAEDEDDDDGPADEPGEPALLAPSFTGSRRVSKKLNAASCVRFRFRVDVEVEVPVEVQ